MKEGRKRSVSTLLTLLMVGCVSVPYFGSKKMTRETYTGEVNDYYVEAVVTYSMDDCINREITLRQKNKLHTNPNHVSYVKATDRGCDDTIDNWYFRGISTRRVNMTILEQDVLHAYYKVWFENINKDGRK